MSYIYDKKRDVKNFKGKFMTKIPKDYHCIDFRRVVVQNEDTEEIVFMLRFSPCSEMGVEEIGVVQCLITSLMGFSKADGEVKGNASHKGDNGFMFALG